MYIPIILGTAREGRQSEKAANYVLGEVRKNKDIETELIDVRDFLTKRTDNTRRLPEAKKLSSKISKADGIIIVSPEYNHGYPGELKIMLDLIYEDFHKKPVAFCGVSAGGLGGARMIEQLRQVVIELHMVPIREAVYFSNIKSLFDEKGQITDQSYSKRMGVMLDELLWYAKALKKAG
ncbi:MAG: NAD(P)H-dependent oxidoreductase [Candidatus Woesearchaeota archaeon]|nr:NAD(P)H-dependent oxidoreductase [Candidatus Woesearchaeota archaeon]